MTPEEINAQQIKAREAANAGTRPASDKAHFSEVSDSERRVK